MRLRPCIDIHNGQVKQIVGSSLRDKGDSAEENFVSEQDAAFFARLYKEKGLRGGHIIVLNAADSPYYEASVNQAILALKETPGYLQVGGGITAENAWRFLDSGASHVIVTSYVFKNGEVNYENLRKLRAEVGKEHLVLDLSCREQDGRYYIVTDRWQKMTGVEVNENTLNEFSDYCDEFLVHAVDVEGKQSGIETEVASILGDWGKIPITYAGGVHSFDDLKELRSFGGGKLDVTVGSALDIFGGNMAIDDIIAECKK
ncbi:phosphoribosylformimino-5-aminoimidazole carboxamide ribotide isomerase [Butyrivibrio sp. VCD2006]|uniref:phosphoribosylformimino-5-aminoimidazole carboxamide ribotide isomerase n=1 Tax=Butyrivibrio sp. VCD2006 TaxID=1280664 RepID=UPI000422D0CF|nr:phosphoribosylformimino-5-aminoimidazole carboxamide ribotide isomerase [Butyrivibrio sp. VCD2006]